MHIVNVLCEASLGSRLWEADSRRLTLLMVSARVVQYSEEEVAESARACSHPSVGRYSSSTFTILAVESWLYFLGYLTVFYKQRNQESHGGLPYRQTPFVSHVLRYAPSKAIGKP